MNGFSSAKLKRCEEKRERRQTICRPPPTGEERTVWLQISRWRKKAEGVKGKGKGT